MTESIVLPFIHFTEVLQLLGDESQDHVGRNYLESLLVNHAILIHSMGEDSPKVRVSSSIRVIQRDANMVVVYVSPFHVCGHEVNRMVYDGTSLSLIQNGLLSTLIPVHAWIWHAQIRQAMQGRRQREARDRDDILPGVAESMVASGDQ